MAFLYLINDKAKIGCRENECVVEYDENLKRIIPIETLEGIDIYGNAQITTQAYKVFLQKGINVNFYSKNGKYFGRLFSTSHINAKRQRTQCILGLDENFCLNFNKKIIKAKTNNQLVILRRYSRNSKNDISKEINQVEQLIKHIENCNSINELMGYEGSIARSYFEGLGQIIDYKFHFNKRTRRPPLDEFNSLISLGYTILMNEIYGKLEKHGLNPYFGFMHKDDENHPTLCSDLLEEWRATIVDSLALSLINGHEILKEHFKRNMEDGGIYLNNDGSKIFFNKLDAKLSTYQKYIDSVECEVTFRRAIDLQVISLVHCIEEKDFNLYEPIKIR